MDIDPSYRHDYFSLEEIKETFDMVLLFEVIEHLTLDEGREMVRNIYQLLKAGGRVILTTPNVYTPGRYWKDATHRTAYHYEELGGLLLHQDFEILAIYRVFNGPLFSFLAKVYLFSPVFRFLGIDYTKSILIVAKRV
jgi:SAM-dependent methyltransferase